MQILEKSEGNLIELKARADSLEDFRKKLKAMGARHVGTFRQIDTYFEVPKGRLKLRETEGRTNIGLVYYEREDVPGPKRSKVFILEIGQPLKRFLESVLKKKVAIDKKREIYRYKGTQIHLDTVKKLGTFIEFERKTKNTPEAIRKDQKTLEDLMETLGISAEDLLKDSYSDIALRPA
jgi:predicted adenylyl cyclase CyaB